MFAENLLLPLQSFLSVKIFSSSSNYAFDGLTSCEFTYNLLSSSLENNSQIIVLVGLRRLSFLSPRKVLRFNYTAYS